MDDVARALRKRWDRGHFLRDYAQGVAWTPVELPIRSPSPRDLLDRFPAVVAWAKRFERDSRTAAGTRRFAVTYRTLGGRHLGTNSVPARVRVETFGQLCALLGTSREVKALESLVTQTETAFPGLVSWVAAHPLLALEHRQQWPDLLATVAWICSHDPGPLYLRQIDVEGVDTKFVDRYRRLLDEMLTHLLPPIRIDDRFTTSDFAQRFGFRDKPSMVRFRLLDHEPALPAPISELTLRASELAALELKAEIVFVVENEISYLAFPKVPRAVVVFGSGFALGALADVPWVEKRQLVYWGDVDTHGFHILHRMRDRYPSVRSILMDERTLLAHRQQWVREPGPTNRLLSNLTDEEQTLYRALVEDRFGPSVRLEQERVRFSLVERALARIGSPAIEQAVALRVDVDTAEVGSLT